MGAYEFMTATSWWNTMVEVAPDGTRTMYHRNGGTWSGAGQRNSHKVSKVWTHPDTVEERQACEVCTPKGTVE